MNNSDRENRTTYKVVVNHEEQYSLWPADQENMDRYATTESTQSDSGF